MQMLCYHMSFEIGSFVRSSCVRTFVHCQHIERDIPRLPEETSGRSLWIPGLSTKALASMTCVCESESVSVMYTIFRQGISRW